MPGPVAGGVSPADDDLGLNGAEDLSEMAWRFRWLLLWLSWAAGVASEKGTVVTMPMAYPRFSLSSSAIVLRAPRSGSPGSQAMLPESVLWPAAQAVAVEAESAPCGFGPSGARQA